MKAITCPRAAGCLAGPVPGQTTHPRHHTYQQAVTRPAATPRVYVCGDGTAYAYHSSESCPGLNRCSHGVSAVTGVSMAAV